MFEEFGDGFKVTIFRKVSSTLEKVSSSSEKVSSTSKKVGSSSEKVSSTFETYRLVLKEAEVTDVFVTNIEKVFEHCGTDIPFGQGNIMEWLHCSKSKATNIMNVLRGAEIVEKVRGLGIGKYRFLQL